MPSFKKTRIVRQCELNATFLPYRRTNRRIKPFVGPGFPAALLLSKEDQRSMLSRMTTDFSGTPPEHDTERRDNISISVPHANNEDAVAISSAIRPPAADKCCERLLQRSYERSHTSKLPCLLTHVSLKAQRPRHSSII